MYKSSSTNFKRDFTVFDYDVKMYTNAVLATVRSFFAVANSFTTLIKCVFFFLSN